MCTRNSHEERRLQFSPELTEGFYFSNYTHLPKRQLNMIQGEALLLEPNYVGLNPKVIAPN